MIYKFKMVSDEVDNFVRTYEIDSDATFMDLRELILDSVGYEKNNIDSFFICEKDWSRQQEITLEDLGTSSAFDSYLMKDTAIGDIIEDEGQRLEFVFDYIGDRCFFMELKDTMPGMHLEEGKCTLAKGTPPKQLVNLDELDAMVDTSTSDLDIFNDEYGDGGYNDDDFIGLDSIDEEQL